MTDPVSTEGLRAALGRAIDKHNEQAEPFADVHCNSTDCADDIEAALRDTGPRPDSGCHYDPADFDRCTTHGGRIDRARAECDRLSTPRTETSDHD